jgi:hypothetical protein
MTETIEEWQIIKWTLNEDWISLLGERDGKFRFFSIPIYHDGEEDDKVSIRYGNENRLITNHIIKAGRLFNSGDDHYDYEIILKKED